MFCPSILPYIPVTVKKADLHQQAFFCIIGAEAEKMCHSLKGGAAMAVGFIKSPLEIMELILFILARVDGPIDLGQLTDLALCDEGVDYFQFTDALSRLESTGHLLRQENGDMLITEKGRTNGKTTESELPYSVRVRCERNIAALNRQLQRARLVRTSTVPREDGSGYTAVMILDDESGNVMRLEMLAPDRTQAELLCRQYTQSPERLYNLILSQLLENAEAE